METMSEKTKKSWKGQDRYKVVHVGGVYGIYDYVKFDLVTVDGRFFLDTLSRAEEVKTELEKAWKEDLSA